MRSRPIGASNRGLIRPIPFQVEPFRVFQNRIDGTRCHAGTIRSSMRRCHCPECARASSHEPTAATSEPKVKWPGWRGCKTPDVWMRISHAPTFGTSRVAVDIAQSLFAVFLVFAVRSFKPVHLAVALKSKDVRANAVEEVPVVRNDHGTTSKRFDALLNAQRVDVDVVRRLVERTFASFSTSSRGAIPLTRSPPKAHRTSFVGRRVEVEQLT